MSTEDKVFYVGVTQEQHKEVLDSISRIQVSLDRIDQRVTSHMVSEHKDFDELISVIKGGKMAAKFIGIFVAIVVSAAGVWEWLKHNFYISVK